MAEALNIFIVSDATGSTAEAVVTSSLVQFRGARSNVRRFPFVRILEDPADDLFDRRFLHDDIFNLE